jgi:hypothetical protein
MAGRRIEVRDGGCGGRRLRGASFQQIADPFNILRKGCDAFRSDGRRQQFRPEVHDRIISGPVRLVP